MTDKLDVIVFGATGFTGRLVVDYLASSAPAGVRWAIAGRRKEKLDEIAESVRAKNGSLVETFVAGSDDPRSLTELAGRTKVIATTVGPYARLGEPLVAACIAAGTDYVDITGEPEFVDDLLIKQNAAAKGRGVRIVNCCGFDSIPHDLGALYTVEKLGSKGPIDVEGFVQARGAISGGTWHSAVNAFGRMSEIKRKAALARGPRDERVGGTHQKIRYEKTVKGWVAPMPTIDPQIVLRSARALEVYGSRFRYGHYLRVKTLPGLIGLGVGIGVVVGLAQIPATRALLLKWKASGDGPDAAEREANHFKVTFIGQSEGKRIVTRVSGGDPGYGETSKMLAESALCLALDRDRLPDAAGILTPAVAMGDLLIARLEKAGIRFEVLDS